MHFYRAEEIDVNIFFQWANDEETRKNSFHTNLISFEEHKQWFEEKIHSENCEIYIAYEDETPVGQVRLEYEDDIAHISYSVDKNQRGKGYGEKIILSAEKKVLKNGMANVMVAKVKYNNISSQKIFEKLGYKVKKTEKYIVYKKETVSNP